MWKHNATLRPSMNLLAKISTATDDRSARLAGIALMLVAVGLFAFGDTLGKFIVATYSVGQLLLLRATAALFVLSPSIWRQRSEFGRLERPWLQLLRVILSALDRDPDRVLRRADCAAALGADGDMAGDDRAFRQHVVRGADGDHALAAR